MAGSHSPLFEACLSMHIMLEPTVDSEPEPASKQAPEKKSETKFAQKPDANSESDQVSESATMSCEEFIVVEYEGMG